MLIIGQLHRFIGSVTFFFEFFKIDKKKELGILIDIMMLCDFLVS